MVKQPQKIYYIGKRHGEKHDGVMTVATEVQPNGRLKMGFSFCSLKDRFVKKTGRAKAIGQMNSRNAYYSEFSGHSAEDVKCFFNDEFNTAYINMPHIWRHRKLANIAKVGLTYLTAEGSS